MEPLARSPLEGASAVLVFALWETRIDLAVTSYLEAFGLDKDDLSRKGLGRVLCSTGTGIGGMLQLRSDWRPDGDPFSTGTCRNSYLSHSQLPVAGMEETSQELILSFPSKVPVSDIKS